MKKSTQKLLDSKKDSATRFKHLKILLDNVDTEELKTFFEIHYSHVYYIFYDCFVTAEVNLKQKIHKAHREELESVLIVLEKILVVLPELLSKRWQCHSLTRVLTKLLHPGNSYKLRKEAIKYFLLYYQILGDNCPDELHAIYATLVPTVKSPFSQCHGLNSFGSADDGPVCPAEIQAIYPPQSGDKQPDDQIRFFIEAILEYSVTQVTRIEWKDKSYKQHKCFNFLFESFKLYYIPYIFPDFNKETDIYKPKLELPKPRSPQQRDSFTHCRVSLMKWIANFTHITKTHAFPLFGRSTSITPSETEDRVDKKSHPHDSVESFSKGDQEDPNVITFNVVRDILYSSRDNINFIHEVYRQAFLMNFAYSHAIRRALTVYKDWIQMTVAELPLFMLEPVEIRSGQSSMEYSSMEGEENMNRLRNDSYLGAMNKDNTVRAGLQNVLQVFITDACNVFLYEGGTDSSYLDDQVDICKRVLNIYRYMVMHTQMDEKTWEQLLAVLLHVTFLVISPVPPKRKDCLSGKLAPAIFQTLIVTWIKANLNVVISTELWDQFLAVLSSLTRWEELIREWGKTMETLTRVLARHVYNLELGDLPLDRMNDQKTRKRKGLVRSKNDSCTNETDHPKSSVVSHESEKSICSCNHIRRSISDNNLIKRNSEEKNQSIDYDDMVEIKLKDDKPLIRKWRSMDSVGGFKVSHSSSYFGSGHVTRSPSPAPSSGVESNSFKESPIQIDVLNNETAENDGKSVMSGGSLRGWSPDAAAILWLRMLGAMGDVNKIAEPVIHSHVFNLLIELYDTLAKIRLNQGILEDSQQPDYVPPLTIFAPWCFQALKMSEEYHSGKLNAYRLLCNMALLNNDIRLHPKFLSLFFTVVHEGLTCSDKSVINTIVKYCGPRFFSLQLPGFSLLTLDFVCAAKKILFSNDMKGAPRSEGVSILGGLLAFPDHMTNLPVLYPQGDYVAKPCPNLKDFILDIILKCGRVEIAGTARCIALSNLGIFVYRALCKNETHSKITEAINTLLLALRFHHNTVSQTAVDIIALLCDHSEALLQHYSDVPGRIIEVLVGALSLHMPVGDSDKRLLTSLIFCLGEWTMRMPVEKLMEDKLLVKILKVLDDLSEGRSGKGIEVKPFPQETVQGFNPNITLDDFAQESPIRGPYASNQSPTHLNSTAHSVQLAAKLVITHLVNNLGHFPLTTGGANLGSLVVEQDDVQGLEADQLSPQLFSSPYIQIFLSNQGQVISLVEVPSLEVPRGGPADDLVSASSQVRVIMRDLNGKSSWDASILYCTPEQIAITAEDEIPLEVDAPALSSLCISGIPQHTLRHRPPSVLPTYENSADDMDNLDDLLQYIGHTSPEVLESLDTPRNVPAASFNYELEQEAMSSILGMRILHQDYASKTAYNTDSVRREKSNIESTPFQYCRLLFSQLGSYTWDQNRRLQLVDKNDRFLRELRNLDSQRCRQTHKLAVIYVAQGQQDKNSILSNNGGSQAYEQFIAGLAWEVELETHIGNYSHYYFHAM